MKQIIQGFTPLTQISTLKDNQPYMVECFEYWCPPCRRAIPHVAEMAKKYQNVYIVSVASDSLESTQRMMQQLTCMKEYNVSFDSTGKLGEFNMQHNVQGIPHCYIFDKNDKLVFQGHPMDQDVEGILQKLNES